ncbi:MAG: B12-binding domain-containing radical SAM protein [Gemmatimonadota bacterium]|nr:MAG: B12-binding domain-containing radical SAM protein [Gemmatimonadota bacterium]
MKVLFVDTPPTLDWTPASHFTKGGRRFPALSVTGEITYSYLNLQAAAILRNAGHQVEYIDCQASGISFEELVPKVVQSAPDVVVMYVEQIKIHVDTALAEKVQELTSAKVGFVGPFVTPLGTQVVKDTPSVDFALRGEYDESLLEVVDGLAAGTDAWLQVEGISVRHPETGEVLEVGSYRHVQDLDALPFPAYDLVDFSKYHESVFRRKPAATMITSRGCPYQCIYCWFPQTIYGHKWRYQSAERVVAEMEHLHREFGVVEIRVDDDIFELNRDRVLQVCHLLQEKKMDLTWAPQCRPDKMDLELLKEMKKAGCSRILYGCESASQDILDKMRKNGKVEDISNATKWTKEAGIDVHNCFILGFPWDNQGTVEETIRYAYGLNAEFCQFGIATPLPGTSLLKIVQDEGSLVSDSDWSQHDGFSKSAVSFEKNGKGGLTQDQIEHYATSAYRQYYVRPQYVGMMVKRAFRSRDDFAQTLRLGKAFLRRKALGWI